MRLKETIPQIEESVRDNNHPKVRSIEEENTQFSQIKSSFSLIKHRALSDSIMIGYSPCHLLESGPFGLTYFSNGKFRETPPIFPKLFGIHLRARWLDS
jgi:hypothetical protein